MIVPHVASTHDVQEKSTSRSAQATSRIQSSLFSLIGRTIVIASEGSTLLMIDMGIPFMKLDVTDLLRDN